MNWKAKMIKQIRKEHKQGLINKSLRNAIMKELKGSQEFRLIYSNSREKYIGMQFV